MNTPVNKQGRWNIGLAIALIPTIIVMITALISGIKWSRGIDADIKAIKNIAKSNRQQVAELKRCEVDARVTNNTQTMKLDYLIDTLDDIESQQKELVRIILTREEKITE